MSRAPTAFLALAVLAVATPASAISTERFKAEMYCKWLPNLAGPLYCSVWRSKCDLPPK